MSVNFNNQDPFFEILVSNCLSISRIKIVLGKCSPNPPVTFIMVIILHLALRIKIQNILSFYLIFWSAFLIIFSSLLVRNLFFFEEFPFFLLFFSFFFFPIVIFSRLFFSVLGCLHTSINWHKLIYWLLTWVKLLLNMFILDILGYKVMK
jgi:hypothetical protein